MMSIPEAWVVEGEVAVEIQERTFGYADASAEAIFLRCCCFVAGGRRKREDDEKNEKKEKEVEREGRRGTGSERDWIGVRKKKYIQLCVQRET